jgi:hypothetical protein
MLSAGIIGRQVIWVNFGAETPQRKPIASSRTLLRPGYPAEKIE